MADSNNLCMQAKSPIYGIKDKAFLKSNWKGLVKNKASYKFVIKLKELLSYEHISDAISWNVDGTIVEIRNEQRFINEVLPMFFKINTLSNFIRQLNLYRFKKIRNYNNKNAKAYLNPYFKRDSHDFSKITRASQKKKLVKIGEDEKIMKISVRKIRILNKKIVSLKKNQADNFFAYKELQENLKNIEFYSEKLETILSYLIHYCSLNKNQVKPNYGLDLCLSVLDLIKSITEDSENIGIYQSKSDLTLNKDVIVSTTIESNNEMTINLSKPAIEKGPNISFTTTNSTWEHLKLKSDSFKNGNESFNNIAALQQDYFNEHEFIDYFFSS